MGRETDGQGRQTEQTDKQTDGQGESSTPTPFLLGGDMKIFHTLPYEDPAPGEAEVTWGVKRPT